MKSLLLLRGQHGDAYVATLSDGMQVAYRLLSLDEYLKYERLIETDVYPPAFLEDEIFDKCVTDQILVSRRNTLKAGVVTTVATLIFSQSGPQSLNHFNYDLNVKRIEASSVINEMVSIICQAFPAYKPDDLYQMDYSIFMLRAAQAERHLLRIGALTEPLSITSPEDIPTVPETKKPPHINMEDAPQKWKEKTVPKPTKPVQKPNTTKTIIKKEDMKGQTFSGSAWDKIDTPPEQQFDAMVNDTVSFYNGYVEQMQEGKEVTIASVEERTAIAEERAKENEKKFKQYQAALQEKRKQEMKEALLIREKARAAKRRKR